MAETRIEKYKKYRESLNEVKTNAKSEDIVEARRSRVVTDKINTTSTLPLEEVLGKIDEKDEEVATHVITHKRIKIIILAIAGVIILAGIAIFAVYAFGGTN